MPVTALQFTNLGMTPETAQLPTKNISTLDPAAMTTTSASVYSTACCGTIYPQIIICCEMSQKADKVVVQGNASMTMWDPTFVQYYTPSNLNRDHSCL